MAWQDEEKTRLTSIANAIKAKLGISTNIKASEFAEKIAQISTGTDTSDATVTADDLAEGVTAYGADGKVTGNVTTIAAYSVYDLELNAVTSDGLKIKVSGFTNKNLLLRNHARADTSVPAGTFGNALASDVASGKTFTSSAGFVVTGTKTSTPSGTIITLPTPTLSVPSGSSNLVLKSTLNVPVDAQSGAIMQTNIPLNSFGNALASDVASGKTFTSSAGQSVSGTVSVTTSSSIQTGKTPYKSGSNLMLDSSGFSSPQMFKSGAVFSLGTALSNLGNASPSDVLSGKTFTSSSGIKVTGTYTPPSSGSGATFIKSDYDAQIDGSTLDIYTHNTAASGIVKFNNFSFIFLPIKVRMQINGSPEWTDWLCLSSEWLSIDGVNVRGWTDSSYGTVFVHYTQNTSDYINLTFSLSDTSVNVDTIDRVRVETTVPTVYVA